MNTLDKIADNEGLKSIGNIEMEIKIIIGSEKYYTTVVLTDFSSLTENN